VIVDLPKLKTHLLVRFTGGVKNMYGCIPRGARLKYHYHYPRSADFCHMLVDVFSAVKPHLTIMDGVVAMEGEGPAVGRPVRLGLVLLSRDAVALDAVASGLIGMDPGKIYTTRYCHERELGIGDLSRIDVVGESPSRVAARGFKFPAAYNTVPAHRMPKVVSRLMYRYTLPRQLVREELCTGCFECVKICPAGAIDTIGEIARVDQSKCINCMCCGEVCRDDAMTTRTPLTGHAVDVARSVAIVLRGLRASLRRS